MPSTFAPRETAKTQPGKAVSRESAPLREIIHAQQAGAALEDAIYREPPPAKRVNWSLATIAISSPAERPKSQQMPAWRAHGPAIQCKPRVGRIDDPLEREADAAAAQAIRLPERDGSGVPPIMRKTNAPGGEGPSSRGPAAGPALDLVDEVLRNPGRPLDAATRGWIEERFAHDFGRVRVHTDPRAALSAQRLDARAYTVGQNVVFAEGQFSPASQQGRRLLAHELAHVVQQAGATGSTSAPRAMEANGPLLPTRSVHSGLIQRTPGAGSTAAAAPSPPSWLGSWKSKATHVKGNIWDVKLPSMAGDTWVGPYDELAAYIGKQGLGSKLEAAHVIGGEHLEDLGATLSYAKAPAVAAPTSVHAYWTDHTSSLQAKYFGGRSSNKPGHEMGRTVIGPEDVDYLYHELYRGLPEMQEFAHNIVKEYAHPPAASHVSTPPDAQATGPDTKPVQSDDTSGGPAAKAKKGTTTTDKPATTKAKVARADKPATAKAKAANADKPTSTKATTADSATPKGNKGTSADLPGATTPAKGTTTDSPGGTGPAKGSVPEVQGGTSPAKGVETPETHRGPNANVDLAEFPPDGKGTLVERFTDGQAVATVTAVVGASLMSASMITDKDISVLGAVSAHFDSEIDDAWADLNEKYRDPGELLRASGIQSLAAAWSAAKDDVNRPDNQRKGAEAIAYLGPAKLRDQALKNIDANYAQAAAGVGSSWNAYLEASNKYIHGMTALDGLIANGAYYEVLPPAAKDIAQRAAALTSMGDYLEQSYWDQLDAFRWIPFAADFLLGYLHVSDIFKRLGSRMAGLAATIESRSKGYEQLQNQLVDGVEKVDKTTERLAQLHHLAIPKEFDR